MGYEPKGGDSYALTASSKSSSGKVTSFDGTEFTLKPSNSSTSFNAKVSGNELTGIFGTITWKDNSSTQGPGDFIPYVNNDPNVMESNFVKTGTYTYKRYPGNLILTGRVVFDDVSKRYAETSIDTNGKWIAIVNDCKNGRYYLWSSLDLGGPYYNECTNYKCYCSDCAANFLYFYRSGDFIDYNGTQESWKRIGDQTIAGKICSAYAISSKEVAVYRGVIFKRIVDGKTEFEFESFTESISDKDFSPPDDYELNPNFDQYQDCKDL